jgi:hypothetical protein
MIVFAVLVGKNGQNAWTNILYINNYLPLKEQFMGWTWSLAIEEQFYILLPCLFILARGPGKRFLLTMSALLLLAFLIRAAVVLHHGPWTRLPVHIAFDTPLFYRFFDTVYGVTHMRFGALVSGVLARLLLESGRVTGWIHGTRLRARGFLCVSTLAAATVILGESLASSAGQRVGRARNHGDFLQVDLEQIVGAVVELHAPAVWNAVADRKRHALARSLALPHDRPCVLRFLRGMERGIDHQPVVVLSRVGDKANAKGSPLVTDGKPSVPDEVLQAVGVCAGPDDVPIGVDDVEHARVAREAAVSAVTLVVELELRDIYGLVKEFHSIASEKENAADSQVSQRRSPSFGGVSRIPGEACDGVKM